MRSQFANYIKLLRQIIWIGTTLIDTKVIEQITQIKNTERIEDKYTSRIILDREGDYLEDKNKK